MNQGYHFPSRWLIATDGSPYAVQAVQYAARLYKMMDPKPNVTILTVVGDPRSKKTDSETQNTISKKVLREAKEHFIKESGAAETVSTMVAIGEPRQVIVEVARAGNIDHLIMGGGDFQWKITDLLTGGVTNYILHHLNCVITVIK